MKHYCVISHTHWDREWYQTQEEFRMRLIDLLDHLLEILEAEPDYVFHMDAQTIVFEDYWEVRPENKEICCRYIKEGRILVGPWYVQNDFFLTSGEATVRNLLLGMKQADDMGACAKTGYTPDQFGLISQLPQIFRGFGIDHCVFGRGYADGKPAEFIWESPDGSEVLGIHMSHWYNNAQRFSSDIDRAYRLVEHIRDSFEGIATTPYLLLMNGVDHLEAQSDLFPILREVQEWLPEGEEIYQTTLEQYINLIRGAKTKEEMPVEVGELMQGTDDSLLKDTASSRVYLKIKNSELQNMLENRLEPLYTLLELSGMEGIYPAGHLDYLWKMLIRNHAHDSICGCSKDAVHRHMEDRFGAIEEMGKELLTRGMKQLAVHVREGFDKEDYQIVVFNGLEHDRTETVDVTVDVVASDNPKGLRIIAPDGSQVPFVVLKQETLGKSIFTAVNLPGTVDTKRYQIRMLAEHVPAFGHVVYRVATNEKTIEDNHANGILTVKGKTFHLENEHLKATILPSGKLHLVNKENGCCYEDILTVQDIADIGNTYIFKQLQGDAPIDLADFLPTIVREESDMFVGRAHLHYDIVVPACYDARKHKRSSETVTMPLDIWICLKKGARALELCFELDNLANDHRTSVHIRTGIDSDVAIATSPYDVIARNKWSIDTKICNETEHTAGMVAIYQGQEGIAVLNRGIYAYEHLQREQGTLTFPIVRATGAISAGVESDDDAWKVPENQCHRKIRCEFAIMPQFGEELATSAVFGAKAFQNPLIAQCEPVDTRKFLGGRPAVQDTGIAEFFYQDIPFADVELEHKASGLCLEGTGLQVTALKKSFDRSGYIFRFLNSDDKETEAILHLDNITLQQVYKTNLMEVAREKVPVVERKVKLVVKPKEIVTLFIE